VVSRARLTGITYPDGSTAAFRYDALGRRVEVNEAGDVTRYAFDRASIAASYDGANSLIATFVHDGVHETGALEMTRGASRYFYRDDALGSTVSLLDINGDVADSYVYDAFGNATRSGTVPNPLTFTGQIADDRAGLVLFLERVYDPTLGRFLSEDPHFSINPYPYVENNPVDLVDPRGAETAEEAVIRTRAVGEQAWRWANTPGTSSGVTWVRPPLGTGQGVGSVARQAMSGAAQIANKIFFL
jgi:RHS repeat-associated protein